MIDVLVAGGGPAGLATAIAGALAGLSVTVVEPREAPIDKACGEGLMPGAVQALRALGVDPPGHPFHGIRYLDGSSSAEARFSRGEGRGVRRTALHAAMSRRADELGVRVERGRVQDVRQPAGAVEAAGHRARYLVAADGLHSPVRASLGLDPPSGRGRREARYGIRRHYRVAPWSDLVEVHWAPDCEVYVTPVAADTVGVAVLGPRGLGVDDALGRLPGLRERIGGAAILGTDRGAGPLRQDVGRQVAGRVLLVGDAAGYVDAITGEGIRLAVDEARAAVAAIVADRPAEYEREWRTITARYRHGTRALLAVGRRRGLRSRIVPAAHLLPAAFARCVDVLGTEISPGGNRNRPRSSIVDPPTAARSVPEHHLGTRDEGPYRTGR